MEKELLTIRETAQLLRVSLDTLRRWDKKGVLKSFRPTPTSHRYYLKADLARFLPKDNLETIATSWVISKVPASSSALMNQNNK